MHQSNLVECKTLLTNALERLKEYHDQQQLEKNTGISSSSNVIKDPKCCEHSLPCQQWQVERVVLWSIRGRCHELEDLHSARYDYHEEDETFRALANQAMNQGFKEDGFPLYARPFVFDFAIPLATSGGSSLLLCMMDPWSTSPSQTTLCVAACLYNLALANHLEYRKYRQERGTRSSPTNGMVPSSRDNAFVDELLERALSLYEIAYQILAHWSPVPSSDHSAMILVLAVCNNLASVHHSLGNLEASRQWKQQLSLVFHLCNEINVHDHESMGFFYFTSHLLPDFCAVRAA